MYVRTSVEIELFFFWYRIDWLLGGWPIALTAEKYAPNKGYELNKQSYCIYTCYYDEFNVLMLVHLFAFAANGNPQSGIKWQKAHI